MIVSIEGGGVVDFVGLEEEVVGMMAAWKKGWLTTCDISRGFRCLLECYRSYLLCSPRCLPFSHHTPLTVSHNR